MSDLRHNRFKGADWYDEEALPILIGGAGGISSWTALLLARANFDCIVYDHDIYEEHNMSGQFVSQKHIGISKVEALANSIERYTGMAITSIDEWYGVDSMTNDIMVSGFDNMGARKIFFEKWLEHIRELPEAERAKTLLIDGRLLAEHYQILSFTGNDEKAIKKYQEEYLFSDDEVPDGVCTLKQTSHVAAMIAARITSFVTNHISNIKLGRSVKKIPFFYEEYVPILLVTEKSADDNN